MAQIIPPRPTPAKPENVNVRLPAVSSRWKGGGADLTPGQMTAIFVVVAAVAAVPVLGIAWTATDVVNNFQDVSESVTTSQWSGNAATLTFASFPLADVGTEYVTVFVTDANGATYYSGVPGQTQHLSYLWENLEGVSVTYLDTDGNGLVSNGDRMTLHVDATGDNPLAGGQANIWFGAAGFAVIDL